MEGEWYYANLTRRRVILWKLNLPLNYGLKQALMSLGLDPNESLSPAAEMLEVVFNFHLRKHLHIVVQPYTSELSVTIATFPSILITNFLVPMEQEIPSFDE
jgi:hypothetical protein